MPTFLILSVVFTKVLNRILRELMCDYELWPLNRYFFGYHNNKKLNRKFLVEA